MGGRGASSSIAASKSVAFSIPGLIDSDSFNGFVQANKNNDALKQYVKENGMIGLRGLWYSRQLSQEDIHEIDIQEAVDTLRANLPENVVNGWFVNADSQYKPKLMDAIAGNRGTYNAGLNVAYHNYYSGTNPADRMPFQQWIRTPQTMYRGDHGQKTIKSDLFSSYTVDKKVAQSFGSNITSIKVRPIDTWGSYQTTGEQEYLIPKIR